MFSLERYVSVAGVLVKDAQVNLATPQGYSSSTAVLEIPFVEICKTPVRPFLVTCQGPSEWQHDEL